MLRHRPGSRSPSRCDRGDCSFDDRRRMASGLVSLKVSNGMPASDVPPKRAGSDPESRKTTGHFSMACALVTRSRRAEPVLMAASRVNINSPSVDARPDRGHDRTIVDDVVPVVLRSRRRRRLIGKDAHHGADADAGTLRDNAVLLIGIDHEIRSEKSEVAGEIAGDPICLIDGKPCRIATWPWASSTKFQPLSRWWPTTLARTEIAMSSREQASMPAMTLKIHSVTAVNDGQNARRRGSHADLGQADRHPRSASAAATAMRPDGSCSAFPAKAAAPFKPSAQACAIARALLHHSLRPTSARRGSRRLMPDQ